MSPQPPHHHRARAGSFGRAAVDYDRCRPQYPPRAVDTVERLAGDGLVIDVGAGTGIFTRQLGERGLDVVAVEPDVRMAAVARDHGVRVEAETFEAWDVGDRRPRVVVFANSWHWVDRTAALSKVRNMLAADGYLVLIWHALRPAGAIAERIDHVYRRSGLPDAQPAPTPPDTGYFTAAGFTVATDVHLAERMWPARDWLDQQFTISTHLVLTPPVARRLRRDLADVIGSTGVLVVEHTHTVTAHPTGVHEPA